MDDNNYQKENSLTFCDGKKTQCNSTETFIDAASRPNSHTQKTEWQTGKRTTVKNRQ